MGHAAQENLLDITLPLGTHNDERDILGFQDLENGGKGMPRIKVVINYGYPGFQEALLPLIQQVPGGSLGDLLIARRIGVLSSRHIQGGKQGDLSYSLGRQTLHKFTGPHPNFGKIGREEDMAQ